MGLQSHLEAEFCFLGGADGIDSTLIRVWKSNCHKCIFPE